MLDVYIHIQYDIVHILIIIVYYIYIYIYIYMYVYLSLTCLNIYCNILQSFIN